MGISGVKGGEMDGDILAMDSNAADISAFGVMPREVERPCGGSEGALDGEQLVGEFYDRVSGYVRMRVPGKDCEDVIGDIFLKAIERRSRPVADIEEGHISTASCILANVSMQLGGRPLKYDPQQRIVVGDEEATKLLRRPYRAPWPHPSEA